MANDVPINPTGFAHGFRPLEGDHPPPTPTPNDFRLFDSSEPFRENGMFSSFSGGSTVVGEGAGVGLGRKRRRLPGPLAYLQHGGAGRSAPAEDLLESEDDGDGRRKTHRHDDRDDGDGGEVGGGHFCKGPWLSLCSAVDAPIPEDGASDAEGVAVSEAVKTYLNAAVAPMADVLVGDFDLRVPVVTAVVDSLTKLSQSDVVVDLVDPSGRMRGYLHPGCVKDHGPDLAPGAALLLNEVSIFVAGPGTTRLLNIHPSCVLAVFSADTPTPTPERLDWLRACDPPFTPRPLTVPEQTRPQDTQLSPPTSTLPSSPSTPTSAGKRRRRPLERKGPTGQQVSPAPFPRPSQGSQLSPRSGGMAVFRAENVTARRDRRDPERGAGSSMKAGAVEDSHVGGLDEEPPDDQIDDEGRECAERRSSRGTANAVSDGDDRTSASPVHREASLSHRNPLLSTFTSQESRAQGSIAEGALPLPSPTSSSIGNHDGLLSQTQIPLSQGSIPEDKNDDKDVYGGRGRPAVTSPILANFSAQTGRTRGNELVDELTANNAENRKQNDGASCRSQQREKLSSSPRNMLRSPAGEGDTSVQEIRDAGGQISDPEFQPTRSSTRIAFSSADERVGIAEESLSFRSGTVHKRRPASDTNHTQIQQGHPEAPLQADRLNDVAVGAKNTESSRTKRIDSNTAPANESAGGESGGSGAFGTGTAALSKSIWADLEGLDDSDEGSDDGVSEHFKGNAGRATTNRSPSGLSKPSVARSVGNGICSEERSGESIAQACVRKISTHGGEDICRSADIARNTSVQGGHSGELEAIVPSEKVHEVSAVVAEAKSTQQSEKGAHSAAVGVFSMFNVARGVLPGFGDGNCAGIGMADDMLDAALEDDND